MASALEEDLLKIEAITSTPLLKQEAALKRKEIAKFKQQAPQTNLHLRDHADLVAALKDVETKANAEQKELKDKLAKHQGLLASLHTKAEEEKTRSGT